MHKTTAYRETLRSLTDWEPYLQANSCLPGPRGNLELVYAAAEEASQEQIARWLQYTPEMAPENTPLVFLTVCATVALGRLLAGGQLDALPRLRERANDPRWRVREAAAMGLQRLGDSSLDALVELLQDWGAGTLLEQRAAVAAICEPRLLREPRAACFALDLLDRITANLSSVENTRQPDFTVLVKALSYCWSVAAAALPEQGKPRFAAWISSPNKTVRKILRENLKKNRLQKMDPLWAAEMRACLPGA